MSVLDCQHPSVLTYQVDGGSNANLQNPASGSTTVENGIYKSSKQVEAALRERGLHGFIPSETETETNTAFCDTVVILTQHLQKPSGETEVPARDRGDSI